MKTPLRIAILECDAIVEKLEPKYGGYGNIFESLLLKAADGLGRSDISSTKGLEITKFQAYPKQEYPKLEDVDAVLLSGSKFNSYDNDPWILKLVHFTQKVLAQSRVRLIGVCFGHQIIGRAMGVKVGRSDIGWEVAVLPIDLTPIGKEIFKKDTINIHQMHRDIVFEYPMGVEPLASSPRCEIQGMYAKNRLITVQGHPEFTEEISTAIVEKRHDQGIFGDDQYKEILTREALPQDGPIIAQAFLRFLLED